MPRRFIPLAALLLLGRTTAHADPISGPTRAVVAPAEAGLVRLEIERPKPVFGPPPREFRNLEQPADPPPFFVPRETVNVALGALVTSSDPSPIIGDTSLVTDGSIESGEGNWVELSPGPQWVQIDLGDSAPLLAIQIWHWSAENRVYRDVIIQTSDDPTFRIGVVTLFNNDGDNSCKLGKGEDREYVDSTIGKLIDGRKTRARYVRCHSNGSTADAQNHVIEIQVYVVPTPAQLERRAAFDRKYDSPEAFVKFIKLYDPTAVRLDAQGRVIDLSIPPNAPRGLDLVAAMTELQSLRLTGANSDQWFSHRARLPASLRTLDFLASPIASERIMNDPPTSLDNIEDVRLSLEPGVASVSVFRAARFAKLKTFHVMLMGRPDPNRLDFGPLVNHPALQHFSLAQSILEDRELAEVARLNKLQSLDLSQTRVTDAGMPALARMAALKRLSVRRTAIGDAGLRALGAMSALEELDVSETRVTPGAVAALRTARPKLKIIHGAGSH